MKNNSLFVVIIAVVLSSSLTACVGAGRPPTAKEKIDGRAMDNKSDHTHFTSHG